MRTGTLWAVLVAVLAVTLSGCGPADNRKVPTADLPSIKALPPALAQRGLTLYWTGQWPMDKNEYVDRINLQPGHLYAVTDHNRLMALDSRTGQFLWDADLGQQGFAVTPVCQVGNNMVAVAVLDQLFVFDVATGKRLSKSQLERAPSTRLVSRGDFLYFGTNDGWLEAVNVVDGSKNWSRWTDASITGAPAVDEHGVYLANTAGGLTSNSFNNRFIIWTYPPKGRIGSVTANLSLSAGGMGLVLVPSRDYSLYAMNAVGGLPAWICTVGNPLSKAAHSSGDQIYFVNETHVLYCTKEAHGEKPLWSAHGLNDVVAAGPTTVYVRSMTHAILALDPTTGAAKFRVPTAGLNRVVTNDLNGQLFAADAVGHIICLRELKGQYDLKPAIEESPAMPPSTKKTSAPKPAAVAEPKK